jgi:Mor family transcriptional regulator
MCDFVEDMQARIEKTLMGLGVSQETARLVGAEIVADVAQAWNGNRVYIGKRSIERRLMAEEVRRRFNGRNAREIARELDVGLVTVYRHLKMAGK